MMRIFLGGMIFCLVLIQLLALLWRSESSLYVWDVPAWYAARDRSEIELRDFSQEDLIAQLLCLPVGISGIFMSAWL